MDYKKIYFNIIKKCKAENRSKSDGIYYESHHILPVALGGTDDSENLVLLTGREHFICHWLLWKFSEGIDKHKMGHAFGMMRFHNSENRYYNSKLYEIASKAHSLSASYFHKGKKISQKEIEKRKKSGNPNAKKVIIDNVQYGSIKEAAEYFSVKPILVRRYLKNEIDIEYLKSKEKRKEEKIKKQQKSLQEFYKKRGRKTYEELYGEEKANVMKLQKKEYLKNNPMLNSEKAKEKHKKTMKENYKSGYENPMKGKKRSKKSNEMMSKTMKENYKSGYENPMKGKKRPDNEKRNKERKWMKHEQLSSTSS